MEYAKDEIFKIRYNTKMDRLEMQQKKGANKVTGIMKRHKLMTTVCIAFLIFATINIAMICSFMNILQNL